MSKSVSIFGGMGVSPMRRTAVSAVLGFVARAKMALGRMGETPMPRRNARGSLLYFLAEPTDKDAEEC
ncbi:MAG: hypothetical protein ACYS8X_14245 [Planctomycetota bacterium]